MAKARAVVAAITVVVLSGLTHPAAAGKGPCGTVPAGYKLIKGTPSADYIWGTTGNDVIRGRGGDDTIRGRDGDDIICGGAGFDLIEGGPGNDREYGQKHNDVFQTAPPTIFEKTEAVLLPDGATEKFTMPVTGGTMGDINVRIDISGPTADIAVYTISPFGVRNKMVGNVSNGTEFRGTTFDSEAIVNVQKAGSRDLAGRFHPAWSLDSLYRYKRAEGTWTLEVKDTNKNGERSTLNWWSLEIAFMTSTHDGSDLYSGGSGTQDLVDFTSRLHGVRVSLNGSWGDGASGENDNAGADSEWIYSGFGADVLMGNELFNDLRAGANDDEIYGYGGNDRFRGGNGNDFEDGGPGTDKLDGNDGYDTCTNGEKYISCEKRI